MTSYIGTDPYSLHPPPASVRGYSLIKLHGSVDWAHPVKGDIDVSRLGHDAVSEALIESAAENTVLADFVWIGASTGVVDGRGLPLAPAIAIPTTEKKVFECPKEHMDALRTTLGHVDRLLIVGWNAAEAHFIELWAKEAQPGVIVQIVDKKTEPAGNAMAERISEALRIPYPSFRIWNRGFSAFADDAQIDLFLTRPKPA